MVAGFTYVTGKKSGLNVRISIGNFPLADIVGSICHIRVIRHYTTNMMLAAYSPKAYENKSEQSLNR